MNASLTTFFTAIAAVAAAAVLALTLAEASDTSDAAQPQKSVVKQERVVVDGKPLNPDMQAAQKNDNRRGG